LTEQEIQNFIRREPKHNHLGYKHESLLSDVIPFKKCIVDMLHLFIRISETLIQGLTKQLALRDNFKKNSKKDISDYPNIYRYFNFLEQKCKVKVFFNESSWTENKSLLHRNLTGKEKRRIFNNIDFVNNFPDLFENDEEKTRLKEYEEVWRNFNEIICFVKNNSKKSNAETIKTMTGNWLKIFLKFHFEDDITPYIHVFCNHLHEFVEDNGNVNVFNVEGLEKLNDISTMEFFKSTNRWIERNSNFLKQIMERRARLDLIAKEFFTNI